MVKDSVMIVKPAMSVSRKGRHVQWEINPPRQKPASRSLIGKDKGTADQVHGDIKVKDSNLSSPMTKPFKER